MSPHFTAAASNIQFSPLAQDFIFLVLAILATFLIVWVYHQTHFSHSETSKGIHEALLTIKETLLDMKNKK
jgi:hypothetical protein